MPEPANLGGGWIAPYVEAKPGPTANEIKLAAVKADLDTIARNLAMDIRIRGAGPTPSGGHPPPSPRAGMLMSDEELAATQLALSDVFAKAMLKISHPDSYSITPQNRLRMWLTSFKRDLAAFESALIADCNQRQQKRNDQQAKLQSRRPPIGSVRP